MANADGVALEVLWPAVERKRLRGLGWVRMRYISDAFSFSLHSFVCIEVAQGSIVLIDGWRGYNVQPEYGYLWK